MNDNFSDVHTDNTETLRNALAENERLRAELEAARRDAKAWKDAVYVCPINSSVLDAVKWMCAYAREKGGTQPFDVAKERRAMKPTAEDYEKAIADMAVKKDRREDEIRDERNAARREVERLRKWLLLIEGGDSPCTDQSQLRQWAYEAVTLGKEAP